MSARPRLFASAIGIAALLCACQSAPTRLYTLYAVPSAASGPTYAGPPVRVDAVHFPPALDRIEIVRDVAPGEMTLDELAHWSAPLGQTARQALSTDLVSRLPPGKALFPHLTKPQGALGVSVDVLEFRRDGSGFFLLASWAVGGAAPSSSARGGTATLRAAASGDDAAATAQALSDLLAQLADRIVAGL